MFPAGSHVSPRMRPLRRASSNAIGSARRGSTEGTDLPVFMAALAKGQYDIVMSVPDACHDRRRERR